MAKTGPTVGLPLEAPAYPRLNITSIANAVPCHNVETDVLKYQKCRLELKGHKSPSRPIVLSQIQAGMDLVIKVLKPVQEYPVASLHIPLHPTPLGPSPDRTAVQATCANCCRTKNTARISFLSAIMLQDSGL